MRTISTYVFRPIYALVALRHSCRQFPPLPQYEFVDEMVVHGCVAGIGRRRSVSDGLLMFRVVVARVLLPYLLKIQPITITHHHRQTAREWVQINGMGGMQQWVAMQKQWLYIESP